MFPIALTEKAYKDDLTKRHRLDGVDSAATAIIDALQPFHRPEPKDSPLAVLDQLTNINKNRRVILTGLVGAARPLPAAFPHIMGVVRDIAPDGITVLRETPLWGFIRIQDGFAQDVEITNCIDTTARVIGEEILPHFERFFE
jgi:hypothetical protein